VSKPLILVDCDGVLASFADLYLTLHAELNHVFRSFADITDFDFSRCVATKEEDERIWRHIDRTPGLVRELSTVDGALAGLAELRKMGEVVCLTSPHIGPTWVPERFRWLMDVAGFSKREVIFAADKSRVPGRVLIDDNLQHCIDWDEAHRDNGGAAVLFAAPYNRKGVPLWMDEAHGWTDVVSVVEAVLS
jgi:5'(3')-deoxyribonucleotidase